MTTSRRGLFVRNITSNLAGYVVSAVVALFLSPFVISTLGDVQFGLWALLVSLTGYYGLLDLGVRSAVGQYVTRYWSQDDIDGVNRTLSTSMVLLILVALVGVVATFVLAWLVPDFLDRKGIADPQLAAQTRTALLIAGIGIALGIPMALWATATYARERFDIANAIGISERLALAALTVLVLKAGHGMVGLAVITVGTQLLASMVRMAVAYRMLPGLRLGLRFFDRSSVRELTSYGFYNFLVNAADRIVLYMDVIIIGALLTVPAITTYDIGAKLIPHYMSLVLAVTWTMTPYATACDARGDTDALRRLLLQGTRGSLFLAAVIGTGLLLAGDEFLPIWQDPVFLGGDTSYQVLAILAWATLVRASTSCGRQILFGMRRMRLLAGMALIEAALNIGLSLVFIQLYGLPGVALGTLVSVAAVYLVGQNIFVVRLTGASGMAYLGQVARATVPVMGAMFLVSWWCDSWLTVDSWSAFGWKVALLLVPVAPVGYLFALDTDERQRLLQRLRARR